MSASVDRLRRGSNDKHGDDDDDDDDLFRPDPSPEEEEEEEEEEAGMAWIDTSLRAHRAGNLRELHACASVRVNVSVCAGEQR